MLQDLSVLLISSKTYPILVSISKREGSGQAYRGENEERERGRGKREGQGE